MRGYDELGEVVVSASGEPVLVRLLALRPGAGFPFVRSDDGHVLGQLRVSGAHTAGEEEMWGTSCRDPGAARTAVHLAWTLADHSVRQRTRELSIRTALGAGAGCVLAQVVGKGVVMVGMGWIRRRFPPFRN